MSLSFLRRGSVGFFSVLRRSLERAHAALRARPRLAAWILPSDEAVRDAGYRAYNGAMFADFHEQERMLADQPRMAFYHAAINRHIQPGDRVVDLGTGTGILAAWAARRGAARVYAIDHSGILAQARTLAAANGIHNVDFIAAHSRSFSLAERVDAIVHEQMGDCLFDEDLVANVTDLRDRVLKPGGLILPSRFDFYCEPIKIHDERRMPLIWELDVHGYDYASLEWERPQDPGYYRLVSTDAALVEQCLGEPEPALTIDLHTVNEADLPRELVIRRTVVNPGRLDGHAVWFRARVDADLTLSSDPLDPGRAPHWGFRILRAEAENFEVGDEIELTLTIGRWPDLDTWRWRHTRREASSPHAPAQGCPG